MITVISEEAKIGISPGGGTLVCPQHQIFTLVIHNPLPCTGCGRGYGFLLSLWNVYGISNTLMQMITSGSMANYTSNFSSI